MTIWNGNMKLEDEGRGTGTPHYLVDVSINVCIFLGKRHNKERASNYLIRDHGNPRVLLLDT